MIKVFEGFDDPNYGQRIAIVFDRGEDNGAYYLNLETFVAVRQAMNDFRVPPPRVPPRPKAKESA